MANRPGVTGGAKLDKFIRNAQTAQRQGVKKIEIGFFSTARYPSVHVGIRGGRRQQPVHVTNVAAWNEFGTRTEDGQTHTPERPFFRQAIKNADTELIPILKAYLQPDSLIIDRQLARILGLVMQKRIQKSITKLNEPPNAESTKKAKRKKKGGRTNPLIDTAFMRQSATFKVDDR